jgi:uncharacterized protein (TIGR02145 family)
MKLTSFFLIIVFNVLHIYAQHIGRGAKDIDGNRYKTVVLGRQEWFAQDLKVTHYSNGDDIATIDSLKHWENLVSSAYYKFHNDKEDEELGYLYNWYVVNDSRNVCPRGWHVPSDAEWTMLINFFGGSTRAGDLIKKRSYNFTFLNYKKVIKSNFNAVISGYIGFDGEFCDLNIKSSWWTNTENVSNTAWNRSVSKEDKGVYRDDEIKQAGLSIRCLKN